MKEKKKGKWEQEDVDQSVDEEWPVGGVSTATNGTAPTHIPGTDHPKPVESWLRETRTPTVFNYPRPTTYVSILLWHRKKIFPI